MDPIVAANALARQPSRRRGFALVDVIVALAVAGVLAALAYPSWAQQVRQTRRLDAFEAVSRIQQAQERWRAACPCYAGQLDAGAATCARDSCDASAGLAIASRSRQGHYALRLADASANGYTIVATASTGSSQAHDGACSTLVVTVHQGNGSASPAGCWRR